MCTGPQQSLCRANNVIVANKVVFFPAAIALAELQATQLFWQVFQWMLQAYGRSRQLQQEESGALQDQQLVWLNHFWCHNLKVTIKL